MEENKLDFKAQSNYIVVTEKDNPKNVAQIEYNRTVSILLRISRRYTIWQNMVI